MKRLLLMVIVALATMASPKCLAQSSNEKTQLREMRGIWVASVANIDWPSVPGLSPEALKNEAISILDRSKAMGLNAVFLQVRPCSDAIYPSKLEPYTSYLVGDQFNKPLGFDPLNFWIHEAHARGLELHAWINPFRVTQKANFLCADNHISKTHPDWIVTYAGKMVLDPGLPQARAYVRDVVMDIVDRYDVDGIHFDDYFYPYPSKGEVFNDSASFAMDNPEHLSRDNWRRRNVTAVIRAVSDSIKAVKPWVQFGISPFGVWRNQKDDPRGSKTRAGVTNYDVLYADIMDWIENDLVDYIMPQIYWERGNKWCDFDTLQKWWGQHSTDHTHIFIGHAVFKINTGNNARVGWNDRKEMPVQLSMVRENNKLHGSVFFSYRQFNRDILGFEQYLSSDFYKNKALQMTMAQEPTEEEKIVVDHLERDGRLLRWDVKGDTSMVRFYMVFRTLRSDMDEIGKNETILDIVDQPYLIMPVNEGHRQRYVYRVSAVDKYRRIHDMSRRITVRE